MSFESKAKAYANNLQIDRRVPCPKIDAAPWPVVAAFGAWLGEDFMDCVPMLESYWPGFLDHKYTKEHNREARAEVTDYWATIQRDALMETI